MASGTARVSKRLPDEIAACCRARYFAGLIYLTYDQTTIPLRPVILLLLLIRVDVPSRRGFNHFGEHCRAGVRDLRREHLVRLGRSADPRRRDRGQRRPY